MPTTADLPVWIEYLKSLASILASMATMVGVAIAAYSLDRWQKEVIGKRKAELATQALITFDEVRDVFRAVRSPNFLGERQLSSRPRNEVETKAQQETRDCFYMAIERLNNEKDVFTRLQSLQYTFPAQFGEATRKPFQTIRGVRDDILLAAEVLIDITPEDPKDYDGHANFRRNAESPRNTLGWGTAKRPDEIDRKISDAFSEIEALCRPVLDGRPRKCSWFSRFNPGHSPPHL